MRPFCSVIPSHRALSSLRPLTTRLRSHKRAPPKSIASLSTATTSSSTSAAVAFSSSHLRLERRTDGQTDGWRLWPSLFLGKSIGDCNSCEVPATPGVKVLANSPLCVIDWDGYKITEADEMYHQVWSNVNGTSVLSLPFDCILRKINTKSTRDPQRLCFDCEDDSDWLLEVELDNAHSKTLMSEPEYSGFCERLESQDSKKVPNTFSSK